MQKYVHRLDSVGDEMRVGVDEARENRGDRQRDRQRDRQQDKTMKMRPSDKNGQRRRKHCRVRLSDGF